MKNDILKVEEKIKANEERLNELDELLADPEIAKNSAKLNEIGKELSDKYNIPYLFSDFKKKEGYKRSIELSKEYNLYRQNYCGCVFSKRESLRKEE